MRRVLKVDLPVLTGLLLVAGLLTGCNAVVTPEQARSTCEAAGISETEYDRAVSFAERDLADGLSSGESMAGFRGACEDECGSDADCLSGCTSCVNAVVSSVYFQ